MHSAFFIITEDLHSFLKEVPFFNLLTLKYLHFDENAFIYDVRLGIKSSHPPNGPLKRPELKGKDINSRTE